MAIDFMVHRRDSKGQVVGLNPYSLHIINGIKVFEQPKGVFQYENGELCKPDGSPLDKPQPKVQQASAPSAPFAKGK